MVEYVNYSEPKGPKLFKFGKYSFSTVEIQHLAIAFIAICATLTVHSGSSYFNYFGVFGTILIFIVTIGFGFVLHELGHKLVAQWYGFISEFRADFMMLLFAFVLALFSPFIFLAPGAVLIHGRLTLRQNGIISVAGPLVNLVLGLVFLILYFATPSLMLKSVFEIGVWVNSFLGIFNMLPFWILDGKKVLAWNKLVYFSVMGALILLMYLTTVF